MIDYEYLWKEYGRGKGFKSLVEFVKFCNEWDSVCSSLRKSEGKNDTVDGCNS